MRATRALLLLAALVVALPAGAAADQASQPTSPAAGWITAGQHHTCTVRAPALHCWGYGGDGQLGYGNPNAIGDDETPGSAGPVDAGSGRSVRATSAGRVHTCALLDDGSVRCWGFGGEGRLGYGNVNSIQSPGSAGAVDLGDGRTAKAISAGGAHTCALLDDGGVRCWGFGVDGRLGYGNRDSIGDDEKPGSVAPVKLGAGRTATAISAGGAHTCAVLDDGSVRCWGFGGSGRLGYGSSDSVGVSAETTPDKAGPVDLGPERKGAAISAGDDHTCALLDNGSVRCWGFGGAGRLGYGNTDSIGDGETPGSVGPVDLGRAARAISSGGGHTCALLDDGRVRCWGDGAFGQLGYGNPDDIGDNEAPSSTAPLDLGAGRTAMAVDAGERHTCALLDDAGVRCWGDGANGRLGYCSEARVGDDETPGSAGPVDFGTTNAGCPPAGEPDPGPGAGGSNDPPPGDGDQGDDPTDPRAVEGARAQRFRRCLAAAARRAKRQRRRARRGCLKRHGRTPGRIMQISARAVSRRQVILTFRAPGSDGSSEPPARAYLVKQARRPMRRARDFRRARSLCRGRCTFNTTSVGMKVELTIGRLRPHTTYYYAIAARDNVSSRLGARSATVKVRTR